MGCRRGISKHRPLRCVPTRSASSAAGSRRAGVRSGTRRRSRCATQWHPLLNQRDDMQVNWTGLIISLVPRIKLTCRGVPLTHATLMQQLLLLRRNTHTHTQPPTNPHPHPCTAVVAPPRNTLHTHSHTPAQPLALLLRPAPHFKISFCSTARRSGQRSRCSGSERSGWRWCRPLRSPVWSPRHRHHLDHHQPSLPPPARQRTLATYGGPTSASHAAPGRFARCDN